MKKAIVAVTSLVMVIWVGVGAYYLLFKGQGGETAGQQREEPQKEAHKKEEPKKEEPKHGKEEPSHAKGKPDNSPKSTATSSTAVITTVNEETNWKLDTPINDLDFNEPKDRDKARRKVARDIRMGNKKSLAEMKESTAEEKEKRAQADAIEAWLEKGTRQDAIQ
ncbi:MAG: hypothetical protein HQK86_15295 [Nitrospinae bacterium]|nr:hypothetical protein [Nitrospinota bacterium]